MGPIIGAGVGMLGSGFSAYMAGKANKEAEERVNDQVSDLEALMNFEKSKNYLNTDHAANILEKLRQRYTDMTRQGRKNAIRTNQTQEAEIAGKEKAGKNYSNALSDLASYADLRRDRNTFRYRNLLSNLYNQQGRIDEVKAQNWGQMAQNFDKMGSNMIEIFEN